MREKAVVELHLILPFIQLLLYNHWVLSFIFIDFLNLLSLIDVFEE
jgi:hypothetical protein